MFVEKKRIMECFHRLDGDEKKKMEAMLTDAVCAAVELFKIAKACILESHIKPMLNDAIYNYADNWPLPGELKWMFFSFSEGPLDEEFLLCAYYRSFFHCLEDHERMVFYIYLGLFDAISHCFEMRDYLNMIKAELSEQIYGKALEISKKPRLKLSDDLEEWFDTDVAAYPQGINFKSIAPYFDSGIRTSICDEESMSYENYEHFKEAAKEHSEESVVGIGIIESEFNVDGFVKYLPCLEVLTRNEEHYFGEMNLGSCYMLPTDDVDKKNILEKGNIYHELYEGQRNEIRNIVEEYSKETAEVSGCRNLKLNSIARLLSSIAAYAGATGTEPVEDFMLADYIKYIPHFNYLHAIWMKCRDKTNPEKWIKTLHEDFQNEKPSAIDRHIFIMYMEVFRFVQIGSERLVGRLLDSMIPVDDNLFGDGYYERIFKEEIDYFEDKKFHAVEHELIKEDSPVSQDVINLLKDKEQEKKVFTDEEKSAFLSSLKEWQSKGSKLQLGRLIPRISMNDSVYLWDPDIQKRYEFFSAREIPLIYHTYGVKKIGLGDRGKVYNPHNKHEKVIEIEVSARGYL